MSASTSTRSPHTGIAVSSTKGLLSLSPELILEIASHIVLWDEFRSARRDSTLLARSTKNSVFTLAQGTLGNLRLVCRYLSEVLEHEIFRSLTFDFHVTRASEIDVEYQLALLAQGGSPASRHAAFLHIKCLNPVREGYSPEGAYFSPQNSAFSSKMQAKANSIVASRNTYLEKAILSFQNLRSVAWDIEQADAQSIGVIGALSTLSSLEDLTLRIGPLCNEPSSLSLYKFHNLRSLSISFINHPRYYSPQILDKHHEQVVDHISQIIGQSPMLRNLSVLQPARSKYDLSFRNLLRKVPATQPLTHLESLHLALPDMMLDTDIALRHLKALKVLRIEGSAHPVFTGEATWAPLAAAQIKVQEITVSHLSGPLLTYLASYSGLKKLHVLLTYYPHGESTRCDTRAFFSDVLPRHALSPTINSALPGNQIQPSAKDGLVFEVGAQKNSPSTKVPSWPITICIDSVPDALPLVLDYVTQSPESRTERLEVFYSSTMMYFGCGTGLMQHHRTSSAAGHKWLTNVEVTDPQRHPPIISLGHKEFELHLTPSEDKSGVYHYRPVPRSEESGSHRMHFSSESDDDY